MIVRLLLAALAAGAIAGCAIVSAYHPAIPRMAAGGKPMWISELRRQDPRTETYLGSPSLVRLPDGAILAAHEYFGPGAPLNAEGEEFLTTVYRSEDNGLSWREIRHIAGQYWANVFVHRGAAYILGPAAHDGHIVIRRSDDGGYTWTNPYTDTTGLLAVAGPRRISPNYHCAPMPMVVHNGRIWRAFEDNDEMKSFAMGFRALVISAPVDADLLRADSWTMSNKLPFDQAHTPAGWGGIGGGMGWLEGNVVVAPDGSLWDVLRTNSYPVLNKAAMVRISPDGGTLSFDPATGFIDLPGGASKFVIRRDPAGGLYWTLANDMEDAPDGTPRVRRNRLSLFSSPDLRAWTKRATLMEYYLPDSATATRTTGFQYVDWQFDRIPGTQRDDIMYLVRTAFDGAHSFHDSNRITFGRVEDFRKLAR